MEDIKDPQLSGESRRLSIGDRSSVGYYEIVKLESGTSLAEHALNLGEASFGNKSEQRRSAYPTQSLEEKESSEIELQSMAPTVKDKEGVIDHLAHLLAILEVAQQKSNQSIRFFNTGNTCYLNALVQQLYSIRGLFKTIEHWSRKAGDLFLQKFAFHKAVISKEADDLKSGYSSDAWIISSEKRVLRIIKSLQLNRFLVDSKESGRAQDPMEFFMKLMNLIGFNGNLTLQAENYLENRWKPTHPTTEQALNLKVAPLRKPGLAGENSIIDLADLIQHELPDSEKAEEIASKQTALQISRIDRQESKGSADKAEAQAQSMKMLNVPDFLKVDITGAFQGAKKLSTPIRYPKFLRFPSSSLAENHDAVYELASSISHIGATKNGGHYTFASYGDQSISIVDDELSYDINVSELSFVSKEVVSLAYVKVDVPGDLKSGDDLNIDQLKPIIREEVGEQVKSKLSRQDIKTVRNVFLAQGPQDILYNTENSAHKLIQKAVDSNLNIKASDVLSFIIRPLKAAPVGIVPLEPHLESIRDQDSVSRRSRKRIPTIGSSVNKVESSVLGQVLTEVEYSDSFESGDHGPVLDDQFWNPLEDSNLNEPVFNKVSGDNVNLERAPGKEFQKKVENKEMFGAGHGDVFSINDDYICKALNKAEFDAYVHTLYDSRGEDLVPSAKLLYDGSNLKKFKHDPEAFSKALNNTKSFLQNVDKGQSTDKVIPQDKIKKFLSYIEKGKLPVMLQKVGYHIKGAQRRLDIKIGNRNGFWKEYIKNHGYSYIRAKLKDWRLRLRAWQFGNSDQRPYHAIESNGSYDNEGNFNKSKKSTKKKNAIASNETILNFLKVNDGQINQVQLTQLLGKLEEIITIALNTDITFYASSVLISISEDTNEADVKIIDLAHPIKKADHPSDFEEHKQNFLSGIRKLVVYLKTLSVPAEETSKLVPKQTNQGFGQDDEDNGIFGESRWKSGSVSSQQSDEDLLEIQGEDQNCSPINDEEPAVAPCKIVKDVFEDDFWKEQVDADLIDTQNDDQDRLSISSNMNKENAEVGEELPKTENPKERSDYQYAVTADEIVSLFQSMGLDVDSKDYDGARKIEDKQEIMKYMRSVELDPDPFQDDNSLLTMPILCFSKQDIEYEHSMIKTKWERLDIKNLSAMLADEPDDSASFEELQEEINFYTDILSKLDDLADSESELDLNDGAAFVMGAAGISVIAAGFLGALALPIGVGLLAGGATLVFSNETSGKVINYINRKNRRSQLALAIELRISRLNEILQIKRITEGIVLENYQDEEDEENIVVLDLGADEKFLDKTFDLVAKKEKVHLINANEEFLNKSFEIPVAKEKVYLINADEESLDRTSEVEAAKKNVNQVKSIVHKRTKIEQISSREKPHDFSIDEDEYSRRESGFEKTAFVFSSSSSDFGKDAKHGFNEEDSSDSSKLKVITWNLDARKGGQKLKRKLDIFYRKFVDGNYDIIAVQELRASKAGLLIKKMIGAGYSWFEGPNDTGFFLKNDRLKVRSQRDILFEQSHKKSLATFLSFFKRVFRGKRSVHVLGAKHLSLGFNGREINVISTHNSFGSKGHSEQNIPIREHQLRQLLDEVSGKDFLLLGDTNSPEPELTRNLNKYNKDKGTKISFDDPRGKYKPSHTHHYAGYPEFVEGELYFGDKYYGKVKKSRKKNSFVGFQGDDIQVKRKRSFDPEKVTDVDHLIHPENVLIKSLRTGDEEFKIDRANYEEIHQASDHRYKEFSVGFGDIKENEIDGLDHKHNEDIPGFTLLDNRFDNKSSIPRILREEQRYIRGGAQASFSDKTQGSPKIEKRYKQESIEIRSSSGYSIELNRESFASWGSFKSTSLFNIYKYLKKFSPQSFRSTNIDGKTYYCATIKASVPQAPQGTEVYFVSRQKNILDADPIILIGSRAGMKKTSSDPMEPGVLNFALGKEKYSTPYEIVEDPYKEKITEKEKNKQRKMNKTKILDLGGVCLPPPPIN